MTSPPLRLLPLFLLIALAAPVASRAEDAAALARSFDEHVGPFLKQNCIRCHSVDEMMSGIRVDHLDTTLADQQLKLWEGIRRQVASRAMPPEDEPQPTDAERTAFLNWIEQGLDIARSRPTPKNGGARRLTVAQYRNTLRELLLLDDELTDILPPDAVSKDGFVNNQETLALSPLLIEAYLEIAERALDRCIVDPASRPTIQRFKVELGRTINPAPCPDKLILGADSLLLDNADFVVTEPAIKKPFPFAPFAMQTKFRFIEGYQGNDTVRGWREYDSIYHAVFACMRGTHGYPKGRAYETVPEGLLLRPAIPSGEIFGVESTYGPRANFKISLRELPDDGRFRVTVTAAKYDDGLILDAGASLRPLADDGAPTAGQVLVPQPNGPVEAKIPAAGIYQVDVHKAAPGADEEPEKPHDLTLTLGNRHFSGLLSQPAFLVARLPAGPLPVTAVSAGKAALERIVLTPLPAEDEVAGRFVQFEKRLPQLGVHLGLRRDCGSTLAPVGEPVTVPGTELATFVFEGAIRNFPSPDVEKDNVNYLAGIREIGVRSEYTDGRDMPRLLIRSVEFEGPYYDTWPPPSHMRIFGSAAPYPGGPLEEDNAAAWRILHDFASRAFRRAAQQEDVNPLFKVYVNAGGKFRDNVRDALLVGLTSPKFLMLVENSQGPEPEPLDGQELASKLSYFLWNGPPDVQTVELGAFGGLRESLDSEMDRLIADPRFDRFVEEFGSQWLALDKFAVLEPDRKRFPKLTRDARTQLRREPVEFLRHLFRENLPARNLIASEFVVANEVVASYYDLGDRSESGFEFAAIPHGRRDLGGLLTQPAILAGLSDGREANPIKRGAWIARRLVAEPPDDPPPNVPMVKEDPKLSLRERLEVHRNQTGCVQCHTKIDPWGLPLEEFDAGGRRKTEAVDARSTLPDGAKVAGFDDLRTHLAHARLDQVAFSLLKHLQTYANGRTLSYAELATLKQDAVRLRREGYRMRDLLRYVVHSPMFLEK
ncbi:DUF1592 domain-containing protein [Planctomyces sp. SH-PL14]|uniref:DUF1592 domain-containing protein n=1 Tax=Planctomyces sp. SH-PL14 TaxID=1632864 RepID=UPI00078B9689|nr:DUF1592 domain-containing protein [Planctomyces sp. SH-PL14]AMV21005.1 hypothetical protein VT03_24090 [Planctomyces sp. SH-PL14]